MKLLVGWTLLRLQFPGRTLLATAGRDPARIHVEHFSAAEPAALEGGFAVVLARTGRTVVLLVGSYVVIGAVLPRWI